MESTPKPGPDDPERPFPIVGIGASAGGLNSLVRFLSALPDEFGFALVFMQHLSPSHKSLLPDLLSSRKSALIIEEVSDGLEILPGRLYLCPPAQEVRIEKGIFRVTPQSHKHVHLPIDEFFISLAEYAAERAIAVIFSGAGTDGARGVHAVRTAGGTVFVQDPATAEFSAMPLAALGTGQVDAVLTPEEIAREILKFHTSGMVAASSDSLVTHEHLEPFYRLIHEKTGYRFNHYKKSVISRRIKRRMYLHGLVVGRRLPGEGRGRRWGSPVARLRSHDRSDLLFSGPPRLGGPPSGGDEEACRRGRNLPHQGLDPRLRNG